jgi:tetratricopeptide (TPR) repeat protein
MGSQGLSGKFIVMPMPRVGSISLLQFAVVCAVLAPTLGFAPALAAQSSPSFETLAAAASSARDAGRADEAIRNYRAALELRADWEEGWWYLGTLLYDSDHFEEAIPALHRVLDLDPKIGPAWAFLGLCEFETGDYSEAFTHLQGARELGFSESPEVEKVALYHLGILLNTHGEFERATELLVSAFGPNQFTEQIKIALGLALLRVPILPAQLDPSKDALIHAAGETAVLLANHEMDAASRRFEEMLRDYPGTPYLHYQYGLALMAASRYQLAELQLRKEIETSARSALPWIALASLAHQRNDVEEALAAARRAVQIAPHSAAAYQALAQALQDQNKHDEADRASRQAQDLAQDLAKDQAKQTVEADVTQVRRYALDRTAAVASASNSSGTGTAPTANLPTVSFDEAARQAESARQAGHAEEAAAWYQSALKLRSNWPEGWRQLGTIQYMGGRYPEAVTALQQSVALETKQANTWTLLGLSEFETKDYKNSLLHLERGQALGFSGNSAAVRVSRYHLALLLNRNGDFDRAIDVLIPAAAAGALSDEIQFALGIALLRIPALPEEVKPDQSALVRAAGEVAALLSESRYDQAFPILEKMVHDHPDTPFLHYAYGDALAGTSMYDEAQVQLREETRLNPASALAYLRLASIGLVLHQSAGALADAKKDAKKAVVLAPDSSEAHYLLGRCLLDEGDTPAAIQELELARRLSPNRPKVRFNLARAYSRAGRTAEAEQERAEFERLNAQMPGQENSYGDRALGASFKEK